MADYAWMRALDVCYERIDVADFVKEFPDNEIRKRAEERIEKTRSRSVVEHDFPKLAEHHGALPKIKDNPSLIFHPSKEEADEISSTAGANPLSISVQMRGPPHHSEILHSSALTIGEWRGLGFEKRPQRKFLVVSRDAN